MRIVVGDRKHHTPIFTEKVSYIVLNPYWKVPKGIVKREIIPAMIRNPNYLRREGLEIRKTWYERSPRIDPNSIYWLNMDMGMSLEELNFLIKSCNHPVLKMHLVRLNLNFQINLMSIFMTHHPNIYLREPIEHFLTVVSEYPNPTSC